MEKAFPIILNPEVGGLIIRSCITLFFVVADASIAVHIRSNHGYEIKEHNSWP